MDTLISHSPYYGNPQTGTSNSGKSANLGSMARILQSESPNPSTTLHPKPTKKGVTYSSFRCRTCGLAKKLSYQVLGFGFRLWSLRLRLCGSGFGDVVSELFCSRSGGFEGKKGLGV